MYIGLHVENPLFLSDYNETWIFSTDFRKKSSNIKFYKNPSSGSGVFPCGRTDITKQIVALRRNAKSDYQLLASKAWLYNLGLPQYHGILNSSKRKFHVTYLLIFTFCRAANGDCVHSEEQPAVAVQGNNCCFDNHAEHFMLWAKCTYIIFNYSVSHCALTLLREPRIFLRVLCSVKPLSWPASTAYNSPCKYQEF